MDSELRKRFNPDGSLLRRQQLRMLELLEVIDVICRKHQIPYWLSSGTLIGAARHKGFIPWDDDLDIEMLRSDYLRLLKFFLKNFRTILHCKLMKQIPITSLYTANYVIRILIWKKQIHMTVFSIIPVSTLIFFL